MITESWKKRRETTFIIFNLIYFNCGFERTVTIVTSWTYVSTLLHTEQKQFTYAFLTNAAFISPLLFCNAITKYADRTKNTKLCLLLIHLITFLGAACYTLHFYLVLPLLGSFLSGFLYIQSPLILAETARFCCKEELSKRYAFYMGCFGFGLAFGPCVACLLVDTDFKIGHLHITYGNIAGVIRTVQIFFTTILILVFSHDISKEHNFKVSELQEEIRSDSTHKNVYIRLLLRQLHVLYLIGSLFMANVMENTMFVIFPVLVSDVLKYEPFVTNVLYVLPAIIYPILTLFVGTRVESMNILKCGVLGWFLLAVTGMTFSLIDKTYAIYENFALLLLCSCVLEIASFFLLLFVNVTLSNLVQTKHQPFIDSIRCQCRMIGGIIGTIIAAYSYQHKIYVGFMLLGISAIMLISHAGKIYLEKK